MEKEKFHPFVVCFKVWVGISGNIRRPGCSPQSMEELELCLVGFLCEAITPSSLCWSAGSCEDLNLPCKSSSISLIAAEEITGCPEHTQWLHFHLCIEQDHAMGTGSDLH